MLPSALREQHVDWLSNVTSAHAALPAHSVVERSLHGRGSGRQLHSRHPSGPAAKPHWHASAQATAGQADMPPDALPLLPTFIWLDDPVCPVPLLPPGDTP